MGIMLGLFGAVLALVLINIPIAVALGVVALVAMVATHGSAILPNLAVVTYNGATSFPLLAIGMLIRTSASTAPKRPSMIPMAASRQCRPSASAGGGAPARTRSTR